MRHPLSLVVLSLALTAASAADDFDPSRLSGAFPGARVASVHPSGVAPWLEVVLEDGQVVYATPEGRHLLVGNLIDLEDRVNLTEQRRERVRRDLLDASLPEGLFEFPSPAGDRWVTVVTDIDCPYCRRLHQQLADYHALGIGIRYLMLPRAGAASASRDQARNAACAADPEAALTRAMNGEALEERVCETTLDRQLDLVRALGITGTPAIVTDRGRLIPGYVPPERLAAELGLAAADPEGLRSSGK